MIRWKLKSYLAQEHQIYSVTALQKRTVKKTGVSISLGNLCKLVNQTPQMLRLSTIEILCTALECELGDFLQMGPKAMNPEKTRKLSFKNTPKEKIGTKSFPSPGDYKE